MKLSNIIIMAASLTTMLPIATAAPSAAHVALPPFSGKHSVGTVSFPLTDESHDDPLATSPQKRRVMVQLFYPTTPNASATAPPAPYGPPLSLQLATGMFQTFGLPQLNLASLTTGVSDGSPIDYSCGNDGKLPLIFFSHGINSIRIVSNHASADLASHGYIVAAVDHPFDAPFVEFPGGEVVQMNPKFNALDPAPGADEPNLRTDVLAVRVTDVEFLIKTMASESTPFSVPGFGVLNVDTKKVAVFGHSLGGAMAADVMLRNPTIVCGANFDGPFYGKINSTDDADLRRPFMLMKDPAHTLSEDETLSRFVLHQKTIKAPVVDVTGAGHLSFCDLPRILDLLAPGLDRSALQKLPYPLNAIGSISGDRMNKCLTSYVAAFFDKHLKGDDNGFLDKETNAEFPEVIVSNL